MIKNFKLLKPIEALRRSLNQPPTITRFRADGTPYDPNARDVENARAGVKSDTERMAEQGARRGGRRRPRRTSATGKPEDQAQEQTQDSTDTADTGSRTRRRGSRGGRGRRKKPATEQTQDQQPQDDEPKPRPARRARRSGAKTPEPAKAEAEKPKTTRTRRARKPAEPKTEDAKEEPKTRTRRTRKPAELKKETAAAQAKDGAKPSRGRGRSAKAAPKPARQAPARKKNAEVVVVDGSNVAYEERAENGKAKVGNIIAIEKELVDQGYDPIIIVDAALRHDIDDPDALEDLIDDRSVRQAPAGTDADFFVAKIAAEHGAKVVSNDVFRPYRQQFPWLEERRWPFMIARGAVTLYERTNPKKR